MSNANPNENQQSDTDEQSHQHSTDAANETQTQNVTDARTATTEAKEARVVGDMADDDERNSAIEDRQREKYEENFGMSPSDANEAAKRDMEPGINDGDGLEIADPNDFFISRGSGDPTDIQPVYQKIPGRPQSLRVRPFTSGLHRKYMNPVDFEDDEKLAEMFNLAFPDLDDRVTADDVEHGMLAYGPEVLVDVIERAAGKDMQEAIQNRNIKLLNEIDSGKMQELMETANSAGLSS